MLLGVFQIKNEFEITATINNIKKQYNCSFFIAGHPTNIRPYEKVLKIYNKKNIIDFVKLEGPSEVIDKIYFLYSDKKEI